jgi:hypothetical protein
VNRRIQYKRAGLPALVAGIALLAAACGAPAASTPAETPMPSATFTPRPTLPSSPTPTLTRTPRPTRTATATLALPPETVTPTPTPLPPGVPAPTPTIRGVEDAPPPFAIDLPTGWREQLYQFGVLRPEGAQMQVKVALYSGRTPAHEAVILVLWDYPAIYEDVWRDGIELVTVVFDLSCQFNLAGSPPQAETFVVGRHYARGIRFRVAECETEPDVVGRLIGFRRAETNYLFYVQLAPVEGAEEDFDFVQAILDTIRFSGEE